MYIVVGSGPTGISAAKALLDAGASVTMLDVGQECEPARLQRVQDLQLQDPTSWAPTQVDELSLMHSPKNTAEIPLKLMYGSKFPYAMDEIQALEQNGVSCLQSHARGGLSNVWGAAVLPWQEHEISSWPSDARKLSPHYEKVSRILGISGPRDGFEKEFPYFSEPKPSLRLSRQAQWTWERIQRKQKKLSAHGISFGQARLAVGENCRYCGLCLSGCPYDLVYRSTHTLTELQKNSRFRYKPKMQVLRAVTQTDGGLELHVLSLEPQALEKIPAKRVFVAGGALSTAKIALGSMGVQKAELQLAYNPYFLLPLAMLKSFGQVRKESLHALAQIFFEMRDPQVSQNTMHMQLYTFNRLFEREMREKSSIGFPIVERALLRRFAALQAYFHSDDAPKIQMHVRQDADRFQIRMHGDLGDELKARMRKAMRKLLKLSWTTGLVPLPFIARYGKPGDGNHIGAVFPMRERPLRFESDVLGRPTDSQAKLYSERFHIVDASVLPSLPATTITFSAMANAHRIATQAAEMDKI